MTTRCNLVFAGRITPELDPNPVTDRLVRVLQRLPQAAAELVGPDKRCPKCGSAQVQNGICRDCGLLTELYAPRGVRMAGAPLLSIVDPLPEPQPVIPRPRPTPRAAAPVSVRADASSPPVRPASAGGLLLGLHLLTNPEHVHQGAIPLNRH